MADVENVTNVSIAGDINGSNLTGRDAATTEGIALTYSGLLLMALAPIFFGAARSVIYHSGLKVLLLSNLLHQILTIPIKYAELVSMYC